MAAAAAPWFRPRGAGGNPGRGYRRRPGGAVRGHALRLGRRAVRPGAAGRGAIAGRRRGRPAGRLARLDRGTAGRCRGAGPVARRRAPAADRHRFAAQDRHQDPGFSGQVRAQGTVRRLARKRRRRCRLGAAPGGGARHSGAALERRAMGSAGRAADDAGAGGGAVAAALRRHRRGRLHRDLAARRLGAGQRRRSGRAAAQARRVHPPPADRRVPGHQPDAAGPVAHADLRLAGGRRPQPVPGGRSDAVDLPFPQGGSGAVPRSRGNGRGRTATGFPQPDRQLPLAGRHRRLGQPVVRAIAAQAQRRGRGRHQVQPVHRLSRRLAGAGRALPSRLVARRRRAGRGTGRGHCRRPGAAGAGRTRG
ncbi:Uncharacterised protein [Achromobacter sp. 2789STDY5608615]|nr:Uncharacterised protein [Achromobacter sp. 2789STDY5608615]